MSAPVTSINCSAVLKFVLSNLRVKVRQRRRGSPRRLSLWCRSSSRRVWASGSSKKSSASRKRRCEGPGGADATESRNRDDNGGSRRHWSGAATASRHAGGADYSFTADGRIRLEDLANPSYPCIVVGFNSIVRYFDLVEWLLPLDEEYLIAAATKNLRNANLTEAVFGEADDPWREHLRQLLAAIHAEAALSPIGRFISQQQIIKSLEQRAKVNYYDRRLMIRVVDAGAARS